MPKLNIILIVDLIGNLQRRRRRQDTFSSNYL
jgi:hypothetical protein